MLKQVRLFIKGDVIGVGFRAWTKIQSKKIGAFGTVRNVYDRPEIFGPQGGVEAVIQAEESQVFEMIEKLKEGPPVAMVSDVEVINEVPKKIFNEFEIIR